MASVINRPNGHRWIQFVGPDAKRRTVRLGKTPAKAAETVCGRVEQLLAAKMTDTAIDRDLAGWLAGTETALQNKLAAVGLCSSRESSALGLFITSYVEGRTDAKPATKEVWRQGETGLVEFFGANALLSSITPGAADEYKLSLVAKELAPMTIRKRLQFATMIFRAAMRRRLIHESPFADVSIKASMPDRSHFITPADTEQLIKACPNVHWRVVVALARYGGLRCLSEVLSLRWNDINWATDRILVTSPKTEHHPGKATRTIPLFPELATVLLEASELAEQGAVYVVDERMRFSAQGKSGWRNCNLRTTFEKIIKRAGLTPWPRIFHNLRSSRQTELAERFPSHVVCAWLGNSEDIAREHYLQVTDEHFARGASKPTPEGEAKQNPKQQPAGRVRNESQMSGNCKPLRPHAIRKTDGEGFEPPVEFPPQRFSRPPP